jgi:hypothetical protein
MPKITYADAVARVEKIIEKYGADHVYDAGPDHECLYTRNSEPSCIVGQVLADAGATIDQLATMDRGGWNFEKDQPIGKGDAEDSSGICEAGVLRYLDAEGFDLTQDAKDYLGALQRNQDGRKPWGIAHAQAVSDTERRAKADGRKLK